MDSALETKALAIALLAGLIALGGAFVAAMPIHWVMRSATHAETAAAAPPEITTTSPELVAQGRGLFVMSCVECHGDDAHGDEGPDLHNLTISNARITATIRHGVKGEMPAFTKKYGDAQLGALVAYLRSLK